MTIDHSNISKVYLLGIGGIGMSALARYFKARGARVSGYDKTPTPLTQELTNEGIAVHFDEDRKSVNLTADLYIYTPAVPVDHPAFDWVKESGHAWYKRSEVLASLCATHHCLAVAGTHGKTTTSAMLSYFAEAGGLAVNAFVGGIMNNYGSNVHFSNDSEHMVVEADEFDRSFLRLKPAVAAITSMDADHLDIYGSHEALQSDFKAFAKKCERVVVMEDIAEHITHEDRKIYGFGEDTDYRIAELSVKNELNHVKLRLPDQREVEFSLQLPGAHNALNAVAALAVADIAGADIDQMIANTLDFKGVRRRFEVAWRRDGYALIDDYAHHPKEIEATILAARSLYDGRKITVVFQPHLFSRTRDFESEFSEALSLADEVVLLPIYPARERPLEGVSSANLLNKVALKTKLLVEKTDLLNAVLSLSPEVVLMLGAGDIDQWVSPMAKALESKNNVE